MSNQRPAAHPAIAVSPYLSLRQAVRPLIFAHALLASERERAGELAAECDRLLQLTRKLLEAAALVHLLAPENGDDGSGSASDDRRSHLIDAYANAGLVWAEVVGSSIALADILMDQGRWEQVYRLARFLEAAEESAAAEDLRTRADAVARHANELRLGQITANMAENDIASAIETMRESKDEAAVSFHIRDLASAILDCAPPSWRTEYSTSVAADQWRIRWSVQAGDKRLRGEYLGYYEQIAYSSNRSPLQIEYPVVITRLLVADGAVLPAAPTIASVIRIPDPIADELRREKPRTEKIFSRLETLSRIFSKIQAEKKTGGDAV